MHTLVVCIYIIRAINIRRNKYIILCTSSYITIKSRTRVHKILASMDSMHYLVRRNS